MTDDTGAQALASAVESAAATERLLVVVDFDGTVSPIVAVPADARPLPRAVEALDRLAALPATVVALVSGRGLDDLRSRAGVTGPAILVGGHGAEADGEVVDLDAAQAEALLEASGAVDLITSGVPGVVLEHKVASVAVHTRGASRPDAARVVEALLEGPARLPGVHVLRGKEMVELAVVAPDKGAAVERLRRGTGATCTVFLGDDVTDESVFPRLLATDVGVRVGAGASTARHRVADPAAVASLLRRLADLRSAATRGGTSVGATEDRDEHRSTLDDGARLPSWPMPSRRPT